MKTDGQNLRDLTEVDPVIAQPGLVLVIELRILTGTEAEAEAEDGKLSERV